MAEEFSMQDEMRRAFATLSGKWKLEILWLLNQRVHRFGELRKAIPGVTQHTLTAQLRELEKDGLISRTAYAEVPLRVDYAITDKARGLGPTLEALTKWWEEHRTDATPVRPRRGRRSASKEPRD
jgi:DNA-binding HxlR family transcriptional regulator